MTARLIMTRPRAYPGAHAAEVWRFYRDDRGVYAVSDVDVWKFDDQERAAYEAAMAGLPSGPDWECYEEASRVHFPNLMLAMRLAKLEDEEQTVSIEMQAFHAPGECAELAYSSIRARRERVMQWSTDSLGL